MKYSYYMNRSCCISTKYILRGESIGLGPPELQYHFLIVHHLNVNFEYGTTTRAIDMPSPVGLTVAHWPLNFLKNRVLIFVPEILRKDSTLIPTSQVSLMFWFVSLCTRFLYFAKGENASKTMKTGLKYGLKPTQSTPMQGENTFWNMDFQCDVGLLFHYHYLAM